jgi:6-pyruvoyltetrahydropterin/6-carboxytetrahydropterin synthase
MLITRKVEFSASHVCRAAGLSDGENEALYGPESNLHGHNFTLEVTLEGDPDPVTGMVMDLKELKDILERHVLDLYDHRFLNREAPPFDCLVPTPENVAVDIWNRLEGRFAGGRCKLHQVRVFETPDLWVDYRGEAA